MLSKEILAPRLCPVDFLYSILAFLFGSTTPASLLGSLGMGLPQYGHSPDVMPTLAATGCPQLGQVLVWTWASLAAIALGLKHMIFLLIFLRDGDHPAIFTAVYLSAF